MKLERPTPELYLAFQNASARLRDRLGATDREIACWIFFDQIKSYGHVHDFAVPPEINLAGLALTDWPSASEENPPFIKALVGAFFLAAEVDSFNPPARYIAFADLVQRWLPHCESQESTTSFIRSRIHQSRLHDFTPWLGETEMSRVFLPSFPDNSARPRPPAEWAMFYLAEVETIEASDFPALRTQFPKQLLNSVNPVAPAVPEEPKKQTRTKQRDQELEIVKIIRQLGHNPMELPRSAAGYRGIRAEVFELIPIKGGGLFGSLKVRELAWSRCIETDTIKFVERPTPPSKKPNKLKQV